MRGGPGEEVVSEWKERHQPTEVMTHINYEAETQKPNTEERKKYFNLIQMAVFYRTLEKTWRKTLYMYDFYIKIYF